MCISSPFRQQSRRVVSQRSRHVTENMDISILDQIMLIYYPILAAVGVPVNLVTIVILSRGKCGLSKCITRYLVAMAAADLMVLIIDVIIRSIVVMYFPLSFFTITPVCSITWTLAIAATTISVWFTVGFTFDRFVAICCQKLKTKYCTERTASVVIGTVISLSCLINVPWYFTFQSAYITDNKPRGCALKQSFLTLLSWTVFEFFYLTLNPCLPFVLLLLVNSLTARYILVSGRVRRLLRGRNTGQNDKDPEMENRRKSIVLLFSISGSFIALWSTLIVYIVTERALGAEYIADSHLPKISFMLQVLSTCTNTCIYVLTQRKFREELKNVVKYPVNFIVKLIISLKH
ncbi:putative G-protein coupled receptor 139 [Rhinoraja longicauda]